MASLALGVKFNATSTGTVDFVYASTVTGYVAPNASNPAMVDGKVYRYRAENAALTEWEWGYGAYTAASQTIARTTITKSSTGAKVSFTAAPIVGVVPFPADLASLRGQISGLTLSAAGATATFGIAAGDAADGTNFELMSLASAYTKTTSAWAVGTGNGAIDTGAVAASTWYHVYLIKRVDTGVVDVLFSLSASAPTMPTNYTLSRYIGSMKTDGSSQWTKFTEYGTGNERVFRWATPIRDASIVSSAGTAAVLRTVTVPTGFKVQAMVSVLMTSTASGENLWVSDPDQTDAAVDATNETHDVASATRNMHALEIFTNTSAQIRTRQSVGDANQNLTINTKGWRSYL
jgi:hypothetical protein